MSSGFENAVPAAIEKRCGGDAGSESLSTMTQPSQTGSSKVAVPPQATSCSSNSFLPSSPPITTTLFVQNVLLRLTSVPWINSAPSALANVLTAHAVSWQSTKGTLGGAPV